MSNDPKTVMAFLTAHRKRYATYILALGFLGVSLYFFLRGFSRVQQHHLGDFQHFYWAAEAMRNGLNPYSAGAPGMRPGYIYPPLVAWLYMPLSNLSMPNAANICVVFNDVVLLGAFLLLAAATLRALRARVEVFSVALLAGIMGLVTFDKIKGELQMFQTNGYILAAFAVAIYAIRRFPSITGLALGFAFNIKYLVAALVPYLFVRGKWRAAAWTIGGILLFAFLPALQVGFSTETGYLQQASGGMLKLFGVHVSDAPASVEPLTSGLSVSITSAIARIVRDNHWPINPMIPSFAVGVLWLGIVIGLYRREKISLFTMRSSYFLTVLELVVLLGATLAFSPQTNTRHTVLTAAIVAMAVGLFCYGKIGRSRWVLLVAIIIMTFALDFPPGEEDDFSRMIKWHYFGIPTWGILIADTLLLWIGLKHEAYERFFANALQPQPAQFFPVLLSAKKIAPLSTAPAPA